MFLIFLKSAILMKKIRQVVTFKYSIVDVIEAMLYSEKHCEYIGAMQ